MDETAPAPAAAAQPMDQPTVAGDIAAGVACVMAAAIGDLVVVPRGVYVPQSVAGTLDSPAAMPLIMFSALGLLGAVLLAKSVKARTVAAASHGRTAQDWRRAGSMLAICALYLGAIFVVGLPIASAIALFAALWYFGERKWGLMLLIAIITPAALWLFFVYVVNVSMPQAIFELVDAGGTGIGRALGALA